jgi:hypothetical protein
MEDTEIEVEQDTAAEAEEHLCPRCQRQVSPSTVARTLRMSEKHWALFDALAREFGLSGKEHSKTLRLIVEELGLGKGISL